MFTVIVHIHSLSSQFFHKSRFQLYSTCHDERAAHANHNLAFSFTSPAENQDGWCGDYMEYGPNCLDVAIKAPLALCADLLQPKRSARYPGAGGQAFGGDEPALWLRQRHPSVLMIQQQILI